MVYLDQLNGSEIRKDYRTGYLSIIVPGRSKRPEEVKEKDMAGTDVSKCPFEPGNENMSNEIMRYGDPWSIRVIENKFPELAPGTPYFLEKKGKNLLKYIGGYGYNEVIIESPLHTAVLEDLPFDHLLNWLEILIEREDVLYTKKYIKHVFIFKNYGVAGGESIGHPHTQIMAYPILAGNVRKELENIKKQGVCFYDGLEEVEKERLLTENDSFFAVAPFGSRMPAESMIVPKRHVNYLGDLADKEKRDFISILTSVLSTNKKIYGRQSYNLVVHDIKTEPDFHMHVEIYPRMSTPAGIELGQSIFVNTITPEDYAEDFRRVAV